MTNSDTSKVSASSAKRGKDGDLLLARGSAVSLRLWRDEAPGEPKATASRPYETVGYVISGSAELHLEGAVTQLEPGDSWVVPEGASHTYKILSAFTAVEATAPPAHTA